MIPLLLAVASGQFWTWTPPAPHHSAAVVVTCKSGASGSGVLADLGGVRGVLTAAHVVKGESRGVRVAWQDGHEATGDATLDKTGADFALIDCDRPGWVALEVGDPVDYGAEVEFLGFGHPQRSFRRWSAKRLKTEWSGIADYSGHTVPGDSGGPILDQQHRVVGLITGGVKRVGRVTSTGAVRDLQPLGDGELPIYQGGVSDTTEELVDFVDRLRAKFCVVPCDSADAVAAKQLPTPENPQPRSPNESLRAALEADGDGATVVLLLGLEGCAPCKQTAKSLEPLSRRKGVAYFYSQDSSSFARERVASGEGFPQVVVYRRVAGKWVTKRHIGARTLSQVEDMMGTAAELSAAALQRLKQMEAVPVEPVTPPTRAGYLQHVTNDHGVKPAWASLLSVEDLQLVHNHAHAETLPEEWYVDGGERNSQRVNQPQAERRGLFRGRRR